MESTPDRPQTEIRWSPERHLRIRPSVRPRIDPRSISDGTPDRPQTDPGSTDRHQIVPGPGWPTACAGLGSTIRSTAHRPRVDLRSDPKSAPDRPLDRHRSDGVSAESSVASSGRQKLRLPEALKRPNPTRPGEADDGGEHQVTPKLLLRMPWILPLSGLARSENAPKLRNHCCGSRNATNSMDLLANFGQGWPDFARYWWMLVALTNFGRNQKNSD